MPFSPAAHRRLPVLGLVALLGLGLTACSSGDGDPKPKPEADESTSAEPEPDWKAIAEDALLPQDLPALAKYKAGEVKPEPDDEVPMGTCVGEVPDSVEGRAAASREFEPPPSESKEFGDVEPGLSTLAVAVDGPVAAAFADLREIWKSEECESYTRTEEGYRIKFERVSTLKAPKGVDRESWFGACYDGDPEANGSGAIPTKTGRCFAVYVSGEHSITQLTGTYIPATKVKAAQGIEFETDSGEGDCREFVAAVARETLT